MDVSDLYFLFQFDYISFFIGKLKTFNEIKNINYIKNSKSNKDNSYVYTTSTFDTNDIKYIIKTGDVDLILNEYVVGKTLNNYRHLCEGIVYTIYLFNSNIIPNVNTNNNTFMKNLYNLNTKYYTENQPELENSEDFTSLYINRLNEIPHVIYEKV